MSIELKHPGGPKAAVALVTLARSLRGTERYADELDVLLRTYVHELDGPELTMMCHTLIALASAHVTDEQLTSFASDLI